MDVKTREQLWEEERDQFLKSLENVMTDVKDFKFGQENNPYVVCTLKSVTGFGQASIEEMYGMLRRAQTKVEADWNAQNVIQYIQSQQTTPDTEGGQLVN